MADARVFRRLECYPTSAVTALTPQNTAGVKAVHPVEPAALRQQLEAVLQDLPVRAVKTGQIPTRRLAMAVVAQMRKHPIPLVVDPLMAPTRGRRLVDPDAAAYMRRHLLPLASLATPNISEAAWLSGVEIQSRSDMERAAQILTPKRVPAVVITGGDGLEEGAWDLFFDGDDMRWFKAKRREVGAIHGTGCHFSAAVCAYLALNHSLPEAVKKAKAFLGSLIDKRLIDPSGKMKVFFS